MIKINVIVKDKSWFNYLKNPGSYFNKKVGIIKTDSFFSRRINYSFSLLLTGTTEIKRLNKKFRNKNKSTDVLSFPYQKKIDLRKMIKNKNDIYLGDIIINIKKINNTTIKAFKNDLNILWVHGLLHLFGYNHIRDNNYRQMNVIEKKFLRKIN